MIEMQSVTIAFQIGSSDTDSTTASEDTPAIVNFANSLFISD